MVRSKASPCDMWEILLPFIPRGLDRLENQMQEPSILIYLKLINNKELKANSWNP